MTRAFEDGATITEACRTAQIHRDTYYEWLKVYPEFSDKMTAAQEYPDNVAKLVIVKALKREDIDTAKWWAERRIKGFSNKTEASISLEEIINKADKYVK